MDSGQLMDIIKVILILLGVGSIIGGIIKFIKAKKQQKRTGYKVKIVFIAAFWAFVSFLFASFMDTEINMRGEYPSANYPSSIENITYGQAFDIACEDIKWSGVDEHASENGRTFIQMDGKCTYDGEKHKIKIQFQYGFGISFDDINEKTPFEISFVGIDGSSEAYESDMEDIIYSMFKMYADKNNIPLDESAKSGILYTTGWQQSE